MKLLIACFALGLSACTSIRVEVEHISHPDRGPPLNDKPEWTVDQISVCGKRTWGFWFSEACAGYVYVQADSEPYTATLRVGREWSFNRR